jgi:hypothetical protein
VPGHGDPFIFRLTVSTCGENIDLRASCYITQPVKELTPNIIGGTFNNVKITFDPAKRQAALDGRGPDFADASIIFAGPTITAQDTRRDYGEARSRPSDFLRIEW